MSEFVAPQLYGIIGYPLSHSLSPLLHTNAFRMAGLPGVLLPWAMEPEWLPSFIESVRLLNIRGCCVTIPHKEAVLPLLDEVTDRVRSIGSVNTLYRDGKKVCGENTDILGFMEPLLQENLAADTPVLILGAGGTSRSAVCGLHSLGFTDIRVVSRRPEQARTVAEEFGVGTEQWEKRSELPAGLIVNTTALGMTGRHENETPFDAAWFSGRTPGLVYDVVYTPFETRLLTEAGAAGWRTIGGLEMFLGQADHQFRIWTGQRLPEAARRLVADALSERAAGKR